MTFFFCPAFGSYQKAATFFSWEVFDDLNKGDGIKRLRRKIQFRRGRPHKPRVRFCGRRAFVVRLERFYANAFTNAAKLNRRARSAPEIENAFAIL
jgi:hypothetical protein